MGMNQFKKALAISVALIAAPLMQVQAQDQIPLDAFTQMPVVQQVSVSPDGAKMGVLRARGVDGGYILEIFNVKKLNKKPVVLGSEHMEMTSFRWLTSEKLYVSFRQLKNTDQGGGNYWAYDSAIINPSGKGKWEFLPKAEVGGVTIASMLAKKPNEILLSYETDDVAPWNYSADLVLYNVRTKRTRTVIKGTSKRGGYTVDLDGEVRGSSSFEPDSASIIYYARLKGDKKWKEIKRITPDAETREDFDFLAIAADRPNVAYVRTNRGQDKAGIYELNLETLEYSDRIFGLKSVDAGGILRSSKPDNYGGLIGFWYQSGKYKEYFLDEAEGALSKAVHDLFPGKDVTFVSRSDNDNTMILYTSSAQDPGTYYLLKDKKDLSKLAEVYPLLGSQNLAKQKYVKYKARDGRTIRAYVTQPEGKGPFPAVVLPHGGPWVRDNDGFDPWAQLLASRGYIVIQPNYRGSTGYGLDHWKAGDGKWGLEMQDDLDDAAKYLVSKGLATDDKLAMFGWSYGGYAAFAASMRDNNIYQCSVAGAGVSNLSLLNAGLYGNLFLRKLQRPTIGGVSPIEHVNKVNIPIFVVHGEVDQRVPVTHSRQFVDKLKKFNKDHKYSEIPELDHFSNTFSHEHKKRFYSELTEYLASDKCFGK